MGQISLTERKETQGCTRSPISEAQCANTETNHLDTQSSKSVRKHLYLFIYLQVLIEFPLSLDSWKSLLIGLSASAPALPQSILNSAFTTILVKSKS